MQEAFAVVAWIRGASDAIDIVQTPIPILDILKEVVSLAGNAVADEIEKTAEWAEEQTDCLSRKSQKRYGSYGVVLHFGLTIGVPPWYFHSWTEQGSGRTTIDDDAPVEHMYAIINPVCQKVEIGGTRACGRVS